MRISSLLSTVFAIVLTFLSNEVIYATKWTVNVQNFSFSPSNLPNVQVGDTIRWVWISGSHTTTSTTIPGGAASWDEPITSANPSYEYPVTVAGNYNYVCTPHAGMGMVGSFTASAVNPVLTSISPNQAVQGASFMATITGTGTSFTGTPSVSLTFSGNPNEIITATGVVVISPTVLHANFTIPSGASPGLWNLHVNSLALNNSFTVIQAIPVILSINPNTANQGTSFTGTINGQYTNWTGTPSVFLSFSGNPGEIITGANVIVVNGNQLTANFTVPSDASPGLYHLHVDALQLNNAFTVVEVVPAILFMSPNFAHQGDAFTGSIYGQNTTWTGTPSVYLSSAVNPGEMINGTNVTVINNTEVTADFNIPSNATTGNYSVHVDNLEQANGFTVLAAQVPVLSGIDPDSGEQGTSLTATVTAEFTSWLESTPTVYLQFGSDTTAVIPGTNVEVIDNTTLTVDLEIPYQATAGLYDLYVNALELPDAFTVIEVVPYLVSIVPDSAYQGDQVATTITAGNSRFTESTPMVMLVNPANPEEMIMADNVTPVNDFVLDADFTIPADASTGNWDLYVDDMMLPESFEVLLFVGIGDQVWTGFRFYPNPAVNQLTVDGVAGSEVILTDLEGKTILSVRDANTHQQINLGQPAPGIYLLKVRKDGKERTEKLMIN